MKNDFNLLLVEDNEGDERLIRELLGEQHLIRFTIGLASSLKESESKIPENKLIYTFDLGLPDSSGLETLIKFKALFPDLATIIILTGLNDTEVGIKAVNNGAQDT